MVPNAFLVLGTSRVYFINVVGTCSCHPRQSTPPGVARARDALRDRGREGTIVARGGAAGFGALALVPTVAMISKPETPVRSILRGRECAPRCLVRGPMPYFRMRSSWFAPCVLLPPHHRRCCCSAVCWLRQARPPRSSAGCAEPDGALVAAWHVRATQSAAWSWANPKHDALLSLVISYLCDRQRSTRRFRRSRDWRSGHDRALGACRCRSLHDRHTHPPPTATLSSKTVHNRMRNRRHDMAQRHSEPDGRVKPRIYSTPRTLRSNRARPL